VLIGCRAGRPGGKVTVGGHRLCHSLPSLRLIRPFAARFASRLAAASAFAASASAFGFLRVFLFDAQFYFST